MYYLSSDTQELLEAKKEHTLAYFAENKGKLCTGCTIVILLIIVLAQMSLLVTPDSRTRYTVVPEGPIQTLEPIYDSPETFSLMLVAGGVIPGLPATDLVEVIDMSNKSTGCKEGAKLPYAVAKASISRFQGHPVVCGGIDTNQEVHRECWIMTHGNWSLLGNMEKPRYDHRAVNIRDNVFWIAGGISANDKSLSSSEAFNGDTMHFQTGPVLPEKILDHCMAMMPSMQYERRGHICAVVDHPSRGSELVVAGGIFSKTTTFEIFNFKTKTWRIGSKQLPESIHQAAVVPFGNSFYVVGGWYNELNVLTDSILEYDVANENWIRKKELMHNERRAMAAIMVSNATTACMGHEDIFVSPS